MQNGVKEIVLYADGRADERDIPLSFVIKKDKGFSYAVCPPPEITDLEDREMRSQMIALWANRVSRDLGLPPVRFWSQDGLIFFDPKDKHWYPMV